MERTKVAILGAGFIGHIHKWYDDIDKLLSESGAQVIDIGLPNYLHHHACLLK